MRRSLTLILAAALGCLTGCSSIPRMPFANANSNPEFGKPLFLMSFILVNEYSQRTQPYIDTIAVTENVDGKPVRRLYRMDSQGSIWAEKPGQENTYLLRFNASGTGRVLVEVMATAKSFPVVRSYFVRLRAPVTGAAPGVYYLGRVRSSVHEKNEIFKDGVGAEPVYQPTPTPGYTFNVEVTDAFDGDVTLFKTAFPALKDANISRAIIQLEGREAGGSTPAKQ